ncbi:MAG TPA: ATP-dependent DNA helicase [Terriglobia bacterium]|nr:ATP-dependent DNA helicase [Terriglobia bacterium]
MPGLNPEQRQAVEHGEGPLLVIAGPGSGKTRVITERIFHLLENVPHVHPENILALTYTEKAAEEMKRRVRKALPELPRLPMISTFHAFCYEVLRERHFERKLLDQIDVWIFLRRRMEQLGLEFYQKLAEPGAFLHDLNEFFSRCHDELVGPDEFESYVAGLELDFCRRAPGLSPASGPIEKVASNSHESRCIATRDSGLGTCWAGGVATAQSKIQNPKSKIELPPELKAEWEEILKKKELVRVFRRSRELIDEAGCCTFGNLLSEAFWLWGREPELLARHRDRYRYVLVDEFQDSNYTQVQLLKRLVGPPCNITAVGDDDQAIYRFRGAAHGAFDMFAAAFPGYQKVYLNRNYRSTRRILRTADVVIERNLREEGKPRLETEKEEGPKVFLVEAPNYPSEAVWIGEEIERLVVGGASYGDVATLYRAHAYRDLLVEEFRRRKIPFCIRGLSILSTVIVRDLVAYLSVIHSPHDNISITRLLLEPHWRFPEPLALEARRLASKRRCSLFTAIEEIEGTLFKQDLERSGWFELKQLLSELRACAPNVSATSLFDRLVARLDLVFLPDDPDQVYVNTFRKFIESWAAKDLPLDPQSQPQPTGMQPALPCAPEEVVESPRDNKTLRAFMEYFQYFREGGGQIEAPEPEDASNTVQMMTAHAAKGLEFPVVFVVSVARQRFPHREERPVIQFPDELRKGPPPPPNIHVQEERRLFYVAMTRAKERLYISSVTGPRGKKPSVFIDDLLSDPAVRARDIEVIAVPEARIGLAQPSPTGASGKRVESAPTKMLLSEKGEYPSQQRSLFENASKSRYVHPPLKDWANAPVVAPGLGAAEPTQKGNSAAAASDEKIRLSATAIEDYRECPLKFKFGHVLRIPTGPQAALTFGSVMHRAVRRYFELRRSRLVSFSEMEEFYAGAWKDIGFEDSYQEQSYRKAGLEQLRGFVEQQNRLRLEADRISTEQRFSLDLGDILLEGRIDQINPWEAPNGGGAAGALATARGRNGAASNGGQRQVMPPVELVDYKTGKPRKPVDAEKSLQLSVYALAARRQLQIDPVRLTFYNLTNSQSVSATRTKHDLELAEGVIREVAGRIREQKFDPTPGFVCKRCDFFSICPAHEEEF